VFEKGANMVADPSILAAIINGSCIIIGAIIGGLIGRTDFFESMIHGRGVTDLKGTWESTWQDLDLKTLKVETKETYKETLVVERQRGPRIYGYITMENQVWDFEGNFFNGRFLQLLYYPSEGGRNKIDLGCYFFERQLNGTFKGYSVGIEWHKKDISISMHELKKI
jgi:hypothetical protein